MPATHEARYGRRPVFDGRLREEWVGFTILRRVIIGVAIIHFSLAAASGVRAVKQVYSVQIETRTNPGAAGAVIVARIVTSGRVSNVAHIELVQGQHIETLVRATLPENKSFFYDPRPQHVALRATLSQEVVSRFAPGRARLRAVVEGRSQFVHIPAPKILEVGITIVK
ncbi:MAG TPA: hypothetical protein VM053_00285 [Gemmatimonadaceae bacterium]|nr:hypothetical protein [Gemmatimonadaceae bacterium]